MSLYEKALKKSIDYFNSELEATTFLNKYALKDNQGNLLEFTPDDLHKREARELARIEKKYPNSLSENEIYDVLKNFKYVIPQGSVMAGIGNSNQTLSVSNCFVVGNKSDSYGGILQTDQHLVQLMKRRAGVGLDISHLRPTGSIVRNAARASTGAVSFMHRFSNSTREVAQGGRRGALMITLDVRHPDIEQFINIKTDTTSVTGANISIKLRDDFMEAVRDETKYILQYPVDSNDPIITKEVFAPDLFDQIINNAHQFAEPGSLFWDRILEESPAGCYWKELSTNPSMPSGTLIGTTMGIYPIEELEGQHFNIKSLNGKISTATCFKSGENKQIVEIEFNSGIVVRCTPEHKWPVYHNGSSTNSIRKKETSKLKIGDLIPVHRNEPPRITDGDNTLTEEEGFFIGYLFGDGWISERQSGPCKGDKILGINFGEKSLHLGEQLKEILNSFGSNSNITQRKTGEYTLQTSNQETINTIIDKFGWTGKNDIPSKVWISNDRFIKGFIDGLLSSDGSVSKNKNSIIFVSSKKKVAINFSKLISFYGISSSISYSKGKSNFPNEKDYDRDYERYSVRFSSTQFVCSGLSITHKDKNDLYCGSWTRRVNKIKRIEYTTKEDVWDISILDEYNIFPCEYVYTGNCGELPLPPYDSCRLTAINLYSFVEHPFTEDAYFNYQKFFDITYMAQKIMDDIVDIEIEQIDKIIEKIHNDPEPDEIKQIELEMWYKIQCKAMAGRRTGLGITGLADMFAALGITYGSKESLKLADTIFKDFKLAAYRSSADMAIERGPFPMFDYDREKDNPFLLRIKNENPSLYEDIKNNGRRNISLLTIAPTGTVSMMAQVSSGIENLFKAFYYRMRKINPDDEGARVDFIDEVGDSWQEFLVIHPKFKKYLEITYPDLDMTNINKEDLEILFAKSPYKGATVDDVNWINKVKLQGIIQQHIDHSISVTTNLPEDIDKETVKKVYFTSWEAGCFRRGNKVYTENGLKDISDIKIGDSVLSWNSDFHIVDEVYDLPVQRRKFRNIKLTGAENLETTVEHPILCIELDSSEDKLSWFHRNKKIVWKEAQDIKNGDHIIFPRPVITNLGLDEIDIRDYINRTCISDKEGVTYPARFLPWGESDTITKCPNSTGIKNIIKIDCKFLEFLGWFIAEGHFSGNGEIRLNFNIKEKDVVIHLSNNIENIFGVKTRIETTNGNGGKSLRLSFNSVLVSELLENLVGRGSANKHLPEWYIYLNKEQLEILIDSHYSGNAGVTISHRLARELFHAHLLLGNIPKWKDNYGQGWCVVKDNNSKHIKKYEGYLCYRVRDIEEYYLNEKVYNFSVEGIDSYVVNGSSVHNCKGVTVYREGSRSGVLNTKSKNSISKNNAPKRPEIVPCEIHQIRYSGDNWKVLVGFLEGDPYEVFAFLTGGDSGQSVRFVDGSGHSVSVGDITKESSGIYNLTSKDEHIIVKDINSYTPNEEVRALCRMISTSLRHGADIKFIVEQLNKADGTIVSFSKAMARSLSGYISSEISVKEDCDECGGRLIREEGCFKCVDCGWSKCE